MKERDSLSPDNGTTRRRKLIDVIDVAERNLCSGCGVCAALAPDEIAMVDDLDQGRRPVRVGVGVKAAEALGACPGVLLAQAPAGADAGLVEGLFRDWGPVRAMWEGHASDEGVRFAASSGGVATALANFALERGFAGVVHIGSDAKTPWRNRTFVSRTKEEVESRVGSRYSPASPGEGLRTVQDEDGAFVFVGKPCDVAGAHMAAQIRPGIADGLALTIAVFCAGTPNLRGTLEMLQVMGITDPADVTALRYRGHGWPGNAVAETAGSEPATHSLTYEESWGEILQRHRQWRCMICPDHAGEFADISVGDPWYRPTAGDPGRSLVVARTERGERFVRDAIERGVLSLEVSPHHHLPASQPHFVLFRGRVWGRLAAMRVMGMPTPTYRNMDLFHPWLRLLTVRAKATSIFGTVRRIRARGLARRRPVHEFRSGERP